MKMQDRLLPFDTTKAALLMFGFGGLLALLIGGQAVSPGLTGYWGYLTGQALLVLCIALACEVAFAGQGGFSRVTYVIAVTACWGDALGNAGGLYTSFDSYDKITHFFGTAAVTSGAYDVLRGLAAQGRLDQTAAARLAMSVSLGVAIGLGWEVYELWSDSVFRTDRVFGAWDTFHDIVSDTLGALAAGTLLWALERQASAADSLARQDTPAVATARTEEASL